MRSILGQNEKKILRGGGDLGKVQNSWFDSFNINLIKLAIILQVFASLTLIESHKAYKDSYRNLAF